MIEPTHKQFLILKEVSENSNIIIDKDVSGLDDRWELVRMGYLKNLIGVLTGQTTLWLTEKGKKYVKSQNI